MALGLSAWYASYRLTLLAAVLPFCPLMPCVFPVNQ
jgi:hypothetical protein